LDSLRQEIDGKEVMVYDKHCLSLSEEEVKAKLAAGEPYVIRQNNPREGKTVFHDELYGDIEVDNAELDDMVLIKSDGYPTYNFANVVDDHLMGITHVVRGNEYISSTPKYNRLYEAFGWEIPIYIHCPLITDEEHKKLSKRSGHSSFEDLVEQGFLSEAVVNFVALLGWSPEDNREILSLTDLVDCFDYRRISKSPAVFDYQKLRWMNGEYLKAMDPDLFAGTAIPILKETLPAFASDDAKLKKISGMVQSRVEITPDIPDMIRFFETLPDYDTAIYRNKKMKTDETTSLAVLKELLPFLEEADDYTNDAIYAALSGWISEHGYKNGYVLWPLRIALSGQATTPCGATEILEILGKEESLKRIRKGVTLLGG
ncbi:MAG: glutamate--tRNA ligase, partial [Lachnospiraceae bacterium]|nr:glutamate--tRNA ligase [Lachnospiraceae bacterium]